MSIQLRLTTKEFIDTFSDNDYVSFFSEEGVGVILERMSDTLQDDESSDGIASLDKLLQAFQEVWEEDAEAIYSDRKDELLEHTQEILAIARSTPMDYSVTQMLLNPKNIDERELLQQAEPYLSMSNEFVRKVASFYAKKYDILELDNGYFMKFP